MKLATFAVISAIICLQVRANELDVMHDKYLAALDGLLSKALAAVGKARGTVNDGDAYMSTLIDTYAPGGVRHVEEKQIQIHSTAADVALNALTNSKNISVVICASTELEKGIRSLDDLLTAFTNNLNQELPTNTSSFGTQRATIALIASQLTSVYNKNVANLESCVDELCFQLNNATATSQFTNVEDGLSSITNTVYSSIIQHSDNGMTLLEKITNDSQSALDAALKAIGQC